MNTIARPFGILLLWLFELTKNYGAAVILFALIVKVILLPFMMKSKHGMMRQTALAPKMKELEKRYAGNKQKYTEEVQKLYKEEGVNPASGCIWTLIPFPILIALYEAIRKPLTIMMGVAADLLAEGGAIYQKLAELGYNGSTAVRSYEQISQSQFITAHFSDFSGLSDKLRQVSYTFLGLDLGQIPSWKIWSYDWSSASAWLPQVGLLLIPVAAAVLTYVSSKVTMQMTPSTDDQAAATSNSMMVMMPLMTLVFAFMMPAAVGLYWAASTLFGIVQDVWLTKRYTKIIAAENAERDARRSVREAELEAKRAETERLRAANATTQNENTSKRKQQALQKQAQAVKSAEWERQNAGPSGDDSPSRVGERRYARGRAYDPGRFSAGGEESAAAPETEDTGVVRAPAEEPAKAPAVHWEDLPEGETADQPETDADGGKTPDGEDDKGENLK